ncbi:ATP-binding protein [Streptomyces bauhiniae]
MTIAQRTAHAAGVGAPTYSETWPCKPESVAGARKLVQQAMELWGLQEGVAASTVIVSELATNAVTHSKRPNMRVTIVRLESRTVAIKVSDRSRKCPVLMPDADPSSESGRGLQLVNMLSASWGFEQRRWGKIVWAEVVLDAATDQVGQ